MMPIFLKWRAVYHNSLFCVNALCPPCASPTLMMTGNIRYRERKGGGKSYSDNVRRQPSTPSLPHTASIHTSPFGS